MYLLNYELLVDKNWIIRKKMFLTRQVLRKQVAFLYQHTRDDHFDLENLLRLFYFPFGSGA